MSPQKLRLSNYSEHSSFTDSMQDGGDFESPAKQKELQDAIEKSTGRDIPALEDETRELDATQSSIQTTALKFREIFTPNPVNHLPTEILTEIFMYVRDTATGYTTTITEGLWPVTHVSRKWRNVTVSMPQLWSYINIGVIEKPAKNQLQLLNTALARSGSHPLYMNASFAWSTSGEAELGIGEFGPRANRPDIDNIPLWPTEKQLSGALIQAIVPHSDRWATASIHVLDSYYLHPIQCRLSSLEKLAFYGDIKDQPLLFGVAPKLREVQLLGTDSSTFQLPWAQLVRFQETQLPYEVPSDDLVFHYLEILLQCPQLENFEVVYEGIVELDPYPYLVHNNLKTFRCSDFYLVRCLTLPSLQDLHLQAPPLIACPPGLIPSAHELLTRSQCASSLRVLRLTAVVLDHSIFDLLQSTEDLKELHFAFENRRIPDINACMKLLITRMNTFHRSATPGGQVLLPRLETFTSDIEAINGHQSPTFDIQYIDETFVDMVEARWNTNSLGNGVSQLRVVKFKSHVGATLNALTDGCIQRAEKMRDEGLTVYIAARTSKDLRMPPKIYVK
ncbi:hypothetical protein C8R42DRAFT_780975 [Lentinula raphanica]|nr:hypothetical protein C8R42DRAFT_780975 [Lentinula raphanica]